MNIAYAQGSNPTIVERINDVIINPILIFLFAAALLIFFWGIVEFIAGMDSEEKRTTGKRHIFWGLIGMFIMFAVWAIIRLISGTIAGI